VLSTSPTHVFRPLFRLDPGWPFVLAGLALLMAALLIPAQRELHELRNEVERIDASESRVYAQLQSYDQFLQELKSGNPDLVRRLAMAQLNMVPKGEQSLLLTPGLNQTVAQWIQESVPTPVVTPAPYPDTLLARFALGPNRLWMCAASVFLLFVGFLLGPDTGRAATAVAELPHEDDVPQATDSAAATQDGAGDRPLRFSEFTCSSDGERAPDRGDRDDDDLQPTRHVASGMRDSYIDVEVVDEAEHLHAPMTPKAHAEMETPPTADDVREAMIALEELDAAFGDRVIAGETERPQPARDGAD